MSLNSPDFDLSSSFLPKNIPNFLTDLSMIDDVSEKVSKVKNYVNVLENELKKIDAFKRELPLCILLLNDAIGRLKEETVNCKEPEATQLKEEIDNPNKGDGAKMSSDCSDKKNWMSSAQLWITNVQYDNFDINKPDLKSEEKEEDGSSSENPFQRCKLKNSGGAFSPLKRKSDGLLMKEDDKFLSINVLSLSAPTLKMGSNGMNAEGHKSKITVVGSSWMTESLRKADQQLRKSRRCWSPELHRRFVNALQQLGGPQQATPKQIREIMQVADLTNDEVKSHLQKYRLHVRKLPASSDSPSNCSWLSGGRYEDMAKTLSGSPEGPLHLDGSVAKGVSTTSVEEDDKSENYSWKGRPQKPF